MQTSSRDHLKVPGSDATVTRENGGRVKLNFRKMDFSRRKRAAICFVFLKLLGSSHFEYCQNVSSLISRETAHQKAIMNYGAREQTGKTIMAQSE